VDHAFRRKRAFVRRIHLRVSQILVPAPKFQGEWNRFFGENVVNRAVLVGNRAKNLSINEVTDD